MTLDDLGGLTLVESLRRSVESAEHLTDADEAGLSAAYSFAERIDAALGSGDDGRADKTMYGPLASFGKLLNDLGLTPQGRKQLELDSDDEDESPEF